MATGVAVIRKKSFWNTFVPVQCTVCLSCGFVAPQVDAAGLEQVRAWKARDADK
jgi:hypothetical protein